MEAQARGGTLILGGGFAGSYVAKLLKKQGATIVSPENFMLFASMLPEAASGTLEPRHVVVPLRLMCPHADLVLGRAVAHDPERRRVQVETEEGLVNLTYRNLVVALGSIPRTFPIPGLAEHAFGFKDLADAIALRNHILRRLEAASAAPTEAHRRRELSFVFVGAGYAGVEALAEFDLPLDERGRVEVDSTFRVEGLPYVWALGDCARVPNEATPGRADPPTSQHALRQARRLAKNLRGEPKPYRYRMLGQVATLGRHKGIADVMGLKLRGFLGWWITRTYHLYQLPLLSRKLRVVTDWTVALLFKRDIAELSMLGHPQRLGDE